MTPETNEQDLVAALDNVAGVASGVGGVVSSSSATATLDPPVSGAIASPFPPIIQSPSSLPLSTPTPVEMSPASILPTTPDPSPLMPGVEEQPSTSLPEPTPSAELTFPEPTPSPEPTLPVEPTPATVGNDVGPLASIKSDALVELRPLVDKLTLSPEEKFDTYLLLIRSTDDTELIAPAHEAAKAIADETRRAEALLDIIKEIDYLTNPKPTEA